MTDDNIIAAIVLFEVVEWILFEEHSFHDNAENWNPERLEGDLFDFVSLLAILRCIVGHQFLGLDDEFVENVGE